MRLAWKEWRAMPAQRITTADCASLWGAYEVPSDSDPEKKYTVRLYGESGAVCSCPAWRFFKGEEWDRTCKHVERIWNGTCKWNIQWSEGIKDPEFRPVTYTSGNFASGESCPACGGKMIAVNRAV